MPDSIYPRGKFFFSDSSITIVHGKEVLKHLDRVITTQVNNSSIYSRHDSLICESNGRILDYLNIYILNEKAIIVNNSEKGNIIRDRLAKGVPWDEEISVVNGDGGIIHFRLIGNKIDDILTEMGILMEDFEEMRWIEHGNIMLSITENTECKILELLLPRGDKDSILNIFSKNEFEEVGEKEWKKIKIRFGIIDYSEIDGNIPFDVGLNEYVRLNKGCYPGQEVHARIESRGKQKKVLVRLKSDKYLEEGKYSIIGGGKVNITTAHNEDNNCTYFGIIPLKYLEEGEININNEIILKVEIFD